MADKSGKKTGGRKKGTPNKVTKELIDCLESRNYSPLSEILDCLQKKQPTVTEIKKLKEDLIKKGLSETEAKPIVRQFANDYLTMPQKVDVNLRLMEFVYPKRKAIEVKSEETKEPPKFTINLKKRES